MTCFTLHSFIQGYEFIVTRMLSCYSHESCDHVERLEWLAWLFLVIEILVRGATRSWLAGLRASERESIRGDR